MITSNRVAWYLFLEEMNFGYIWIEWCISFVIFLVLNDISSKGLLLLSVYIFCISLFFYLFLVVAESLSCFLKRAKEGGHF